MHTRADKTQKNNGRRIADELSPRSGGGESAFQFVDNRPEAVACRKLPEMANNSDNVRQLKTLQALTDVSPRVSQSRDLSHPAASGETAVMQLRSRLGGLMTDRFEPSGAQSGRVNTLLGRINDVSLLMRGAGTIDTEGDVRLDMQGMTANGYYNLQIQIGTRQTGGTVSTVLLHSEVTRGQLEEVIEAFRHSWATGRTVIVDPDEEAKVQKPKGYYDDYKKLSRDDKETIDRSMEQGVYPPRKDLK